jgi:hypothetical protein
MSRTRSVPFAGLAQVDQADGAHRDAVRRDRAQLRDPGRDAGRGLARVERLGRPLQHQVRSRILPGSPTVRPAAASRSRGASITFPALAHRHEARRRTP